MLRESVATESVDLIYLDPPFNSKRDYNLLFKSPKAPAGGEGNRFLHVETDVVEVDYRNTLLVEVSRQGQVIC